LTQLLPEQLSLETYNSQYLQRHSTSVQAILAAAKVLYTLQSPLEEIEATIFTALAVEAKLDITVSVFLQY
jgi:peptide alpha-N-acetyltransferase